MKLTMSERLVKIGRIRGVHGLFGFLRIEAFNPESPMFQNDSVLLVGSEKHNVQYKIEQTKSTTRQILIKLEGIDNIESAKRLIGKYIMVPRSWLPEIAEDEYYMEDLVGMEVVDTNGNRLGVISGFDTNGIQDLLVIESNGLRFLLPDIPEFVLEIDIENQRLVADPPDGLFDDPSLGEKIKSR